MLKSEGKNTNNFTNKNVTSSHNNNKETNLVSDLVGGEEEEDIAELEGAATKIQAVFRGHQTRKTMKQADRPNVSEPEPEQTKEQLEAEFRADDAGNTTKLLLTTSIHRTSNALKNSFNLIDIWIYRCFRNIKIFNKAHRQFTANNLPWDTLLNGHYAVI